MAIENPIFRQTTEQTDAENLAAQKDELNASDFRDRLGNTFKSFFSELGEEGYRTRRAAAVVVAGTTQVAERARLMAVALPYTFDEVLQHSMENGWNGYQTAGAAGVALAGVNAGWNYAVGKSFKRSLDELPDTVDAVTANHPVMVGTIDGAIGGIVQPDELQQKHSVRPEGGYEVGPYDASSRRIGKAVLAVKRGYSALLVFGATPYIGVAKARDYSNESNDKLRRAVTAESAAAVGVLGAGVSGLVTNNALGAAETIRDTVANKSLWIGVSAGLIGYSAAANMIARRKYERSQSDTQNS